MEIHFLKGSSGLQRPSLHTEFKKFCKPYQIAEYRGNFLLRLCNIALMLRQSTAYKCVICDKAGIQSLGFVSLGFFFLDRHQWWSLSLRMVHIRNAMDILNLT